MKYTFDLHSIGEMRWARNMLDRRIKQLEDMEREWEMENHNRRWDINYRELDNHIKSRFDMDDSLHDPNTCSFCKDLKDDFVKSKKEPKSD